MTHWSAPFESEMRRILPHDLPGDRPLYLVDIGEAGPGFDLNGAKVRAYTTPHLDLQLKWRLEAAGRWRGRGDAIIVFREKLKDEHELQSILLHEFAHRIEFTTFQTYDLPAEDWPDELEYRTPPNIREAVAAEREAALPVPPPPWQSHDWRFIRIALHVFHRAFLAGFFCTPFDLLIAGDTYGISSSMDYLRTLGDEPDRCLDRSLRYLFTIPPPQPFIDLFEADKARYESEHQPAAASPT